MMNPEEPPRQNEEPAPLPSEHTDPPRPSTYAGRRLQGERPAPEGDGAATGQAAPEGDGAAGEQALPEGDGAAGEQAAPEGDGAAPARAAADTVETDTVALADREAAQEAALRGLKARAAAHSTKTHALLRDPARPAAAPSATAPSPAAAAPPGAPPRPPAAAPPSGPRPPAAAPPKPAAAAPPPSGPPTPSADIGQPPKRGMWARFLAGSVVIVATVAAATAVSGLLGLYDIAKGLGGIPIAQNLLADTNPSGPQTILILGSDKRPGETGHGLSDTTILLRLTSSGISFMSIPRDLQVDIPGHGVNKFNAAYTYGGPQLTLRVVKQLTGLQINHVVNVDFTGFADAVNAIGCVYYNVDHHYYHSNYGLPPSEQYAAIDIKAGYQLMCGYKALQFVRYRHDDNDLVRSARQQAFLREARAQIPPISLLSRFNNLVRIFGKYTTSDPGLRDIAKVEGLAKLLFAARSAPIHEVHFPAIFGGPSAAYITAHRTQIHKAVREFLGETPSSASAQPSSGGGSGAKKGGSSKSGGPSSHSGPAPAPAPLIDSTTSGQNYAAQMDRPVWKRRSKLPIYYPTKVVPGSQLTSDLRAYPIDGPGSSVYYGYTFVAEVPTDGYAAYYDFTGTNWHDPPILNNPTETKDINGHSFELFWDSGRLRLVAWKTSNGSYWVDNDLLETLTPGQMVGMAEAMREYTG
jgi:polyisoprenyl-teichoic acid--peptidoglycan teichoic acid transferase